MTVEQRLAILEREVAELKEKLADAHAKPNWIDRVKGPFKGVPEFGEILRLGKEIRQSQKTTEDA
jgi:hypothetical protein